MKTVRVIFLLVSFWSWSFILAQSHTHFSTGDSARNSKRWEWHQPAAVVYMHNGDSLSGQPIHFDMEDLSVLPGVDLPIDMEGKLLSIPYGDIAGIKISRGGRITLAQTSGIIIGTGIGTVAGFAIGGPVLAPLLGGPLGVAGGFLGKGLHENMTNAFLNLDNQEPGYKDQLMKLRHWSVFEDSVCYTLKLEELPAYSKAIRRAYPQKHFRIGIHLSLGYSPVKGQASELLSGSDLPVPASVYSRLFGLEFADFSWRFKNKWIVGVAYFAYFDDLYIGDYYAYPPGPDQSLTSYSLNLTLNDWRFYCEYVLSPVDRFFVGNDEFTVGLGLLAGRPGMSFWGNLEDPETDYYGYSGISRRYTSPGLQLRGSYQYYPARNISLSAGIEFNYYPDLMVDGVSYPENHPDYPEQILAPYRYNFSNLRLKAGLNYYF